MFKMCQNPRFDANQRFVQFENVDFGRDKRERYFEFEQ